MGRNGAVLGIESLRLYLFSLSPRFYFSQKTLSENRKTLCLFFKITHISNGFCEGAVRRESFVPRFSIQKTSVKSSSAI